MGGTSGSGTRNTVFQNQTDAVLNQAAPVQNTWYTVLDTTFNVYVYSITSKVADTGETVACRVTIDGNELVIAFAAVADTKYVYFMNGFDGNLYSEIAGTMVNWGIYKFEGRSIKIELRKVTANGAGTLSGRVVYGKIP